MEAAQQARNDVKPQEPLDLQLQLLSISLPSFPLPRSYPPVGCEVLGLQSDEEATPQARGNGHKHVPLVYHTTNKGGRAGQQGIKEQGQGERCSLSTPAISPASPPDIQHAPACAMHSPLRSTTAAQPQPLHCPCATPCPKRTPMLAVTPLHSTAAVHPASLHCPCASHAPAPVPSHASAAVHPRQ